MNLSHPKNLETLRGECEKLGVRVARLAFIRAVLFVLFVFTLASAFQIISSNDASGIVNRIRKLQKITQEEVHLDEFLTAIYFLRTQNLDVGKSFEILLSDSGRVYRVPVNVTERKTIDTAVGRVKAIRVEPALFGDDALLHTRGQLSIWLTEDERHLPVRAQLKVEIGTFDIKLKRVTYSDATAK